MTKIAYDQNIIEADRFFAEFGELIPFDGRSVTKNSLPQCDALLVRSVTKVNNTLLADSSLSFVGTATAGIDHIDTQCLKEKGIGFASAAGSNATSVAEYVLSAITHLQLINTPKKITVGIIGYGHVGKETARVLTALNIDVLLYDPPLKELTQNPDLVPIEDLYNVDILSIHTPLTTKNESKYPTELFINEQLLQNFKHGLTLINTSRGEVLHEPDIIRLKKEGVIQHLVLDVFKNEPNPSTKLLEVCTLFTPHIAGYSYTGKIRGTKMMRQALIQFFKFPELTTTHHLEPNIITYTNETENDFILHCINTVFTINNDYEKAKELLHSHEPAVLFDRLRKTYQKRLECSDYTITGTLPESLNKVLTDLGFKTSLS